MSLDASTAALLLSQYSYRGKPLVSQIDAEPLAVAGNYVVFKLHTAADPESEVAEEREWAAWLREHGVDVGYSKEDLVPLPSGGVFAEAVLGRFNSAEKLDITRFWNWQDSPIPLQAPEIAAIQTGSRATEEDLKAQPFSQPLVNIVSPTALPDPSGMAVDPGRDPERQHVPGHEWADGHDRARPRRAGGDERGRRTGWRAGGRESS